MKKSASDKHPDFTGQGLVNGVEVWASMWVKRSSKTGEDFFSISVRPKDEARRESAQRQEQARVQQTYAEEGYADRGPAPRSAPSRFQRPSQPPRDQGPPPQSQEWPGEGDWEQEP